MNTKTQQTMFSTGKDNWETPDDLFQIYHDRYRFVLDAAADSHNHKCPDWLGPGGLHDDALEVSWQPWLRKGSIWLNPPYSRGLQARFVAKAVEEARKIQATWRTEREKDMTKLLDWEYGSIVCLLPARTDTKIFHELVVPNHRYEIIFLKGRVRFKGAAAGAPFPSMIVVF